MSATVNAPYLAISLCCDNFLHVSLFKFKSFLFSPQTSQITVLQNGIVYILLQ